MRKKNEDQHAILPGNEVKQGRYIHFKGNEYEVICTAVHSETMERMVVYFDVNGDGSVWVRPATMWNETIEVNGQSVKRFEYIGE